jgi:hypothetical protein
VVIHGPVPGPVVVAVPVIVAASEGEMLGWIVESGIG